MRSKKESEKIKRGRRSFTSHGSPPSERLEQAIQILTSVALTSITVMQMLSVIKLMDVITAHAALDTLEMEHHAPVDYQGSGRSRPSDRGEGGWGGSDNIFKSTN